MKKNSTNGFMMIAILMQLLHAMRGELSFIIEGKFPYVLYYGTMGLYVACLMGYLFGITKRLINKEKCSANSQLKTRKSIFFKADK